MVIEPTEAGFGEVGFNSVAMICDLSVSEPLPVYAPKFTLKLVSPVPLVELTNVMSIGLKPDSAWSVNCQDTVLGVTSRL